MNNIHLEKYFEYDIVAHRCARGWVEGESQADYRAPLALCPKDALNWVKTAKMDKLVAETKSAIELLKEHRSALISSAVTGKINVEGEV